MKVKHVFLIIISLLIKSSNILSQETHEHLKCSVVKVIVNGECKGAGIILGVDDFKRVYILTSYHVIENSIEHEKMPYIEFYNFQGHHFRAEMNHKYIDKKSYDLAGLIVSFKNEKLVDEIEEINFADSVRIADGESVCIVGHPIGFNWKVDKTMEKIGILDDDIVIRGQISEGNSGGPVLDNNFKMIGLMTKKEEDNTLGYALEIDFIKELLENWKFPPQGLINIHGQVLKRNKNIGLKDVDLIFWLNNKKEGSTKTDENGNFSIKIGPDDIKKKITLKIHDNRFKSWGNTYNIQNIIKKGIKDIKLTFKEKPNDGKLKWLLLIGWSLFTVFELILLLKPEAFGE